MHDKRLIVMGVCFSIMAVCQLQPFIRANVVFDALIWIIAVSLAGGVMSVLTPRAAHLYLLVFVLIWLGFGVGLAAAGVFIFWLVSAWSLGLLLLRWIGNRQDTESRFTEPLILGSAVWLAIWSGMLHFAINYSLLYLVLCLLPCFLITSHVPALRNDLRSHANAIQEWMRSIPLWAWVAGLIVIGWVLRWASFPSMSYDDHALHLRVWTELLTQHRYSFDIHTQIWSVAPFAVDLLHGGLSLMAGSDARSAMNLGLAILLFFLMARILRKWSLPARIQWLLIVLMASTPMLGNLLLSLQTELMLAVLALAGLGLVLDAKGCWRGQYVLGVLACAALCAATKLPGVVLGVTLLVALMLRWWEQRSAPVLVQYRLGWPALLILVPLGFVALHSYIYAWKVTANPVFPLYNAIFLSPYFSPVNFSDSRWVHGFNLWNYVRTFFHTSEFIEAGNYTAGWQYLVMLPIAVLALLRSSIPNGLRIALVPLLGFGLVMFSATQYWRYLFPVMPLAGIMLAALFIGNNRIFRKIALALSLACIAANLFYFDKVSWMMNSPAGMAFTQEGKKFLIQMYAPAALLTNKINNLYPEARVLYPSSIPYGATLHGSPLYVNWYSPFRAAKYNSLMDFKGVANFISQEKIDLVIMSIEDTRTSHNPDVLLREFLAQYGSVVGQESRLLLYRVSESPVLYSNIFNLQASMAKQTEAVDLMLPIKDEGIAVSSESKVLAVFPTLGAKQARYRVEFGCPSGQGYFVAQINWDKGAPYYRLVSCEAKNVSFIEAIPVPLGASKGEIFVTSRETSSVQVKNIVVELH